MGRRASCANVLRHSVTVLQHARKCALALALPYVSRALTATELLSLLPSRFLLPPLVPASLRPLVSSLTERVWTPSHFLPLHPPLHFPLRFTSSVVERARRRCCHPLSPLGLYVLAQRARSA